MGFSGRRCKIDHGNFLQNLSENKPKAGAELNLELDLELELS